MFKRISNGLYQLSKGRIALVALVIFLLFTALVLPGQADRAEAQTGRPESPDTAIFYAKDDLYQLAETYGEQGRAAYVRARFTFDLVFPLVYAFFLTSAVGWLFKRAFSQNGWWQFVILIPPFGMLFDFLENISTSLVMVRYPDRTPIVDWLAPVFSAIKWVFISGSFVLLFIGIAALLWRGVRRIASRTD